MDLALTIAIEGGRIAAGVVDRAGKLVHAEAPDDEGEPAPLVDSLIDLVERINARTGRLPGPLAACGLSVEPDPDPSRDTDLAARLADIVADLVHLPVHVDASGRALALAEGWVGAAKGVSNFAAVRIGDTVSGGVVLDGELLDGALGRAGRIGHIVVTPDGRRCACGARGCLQSEVSVGAIEAASGRPLTEPTYDVMRNAGTLVGRALASVANLLDLKLVVVGGRVALEYSSTLYLAAQEELDASCRLAFSRGARVSSARAPEPVGLVGAAAVAWRGLARGGR